jgi:hypothetical protein
MRSFRILAIASILLGALTADVSLAAKAAAAAQGSDVSATAPVPPNAERILRGGDFVHPLQFSATDQDNYLAGLQAAGVRVIRFGMYEQDMDKNVDFIKLAHSHGIAAVLILHGISTPGAPERPFRPNEFPGMWPGPPLSYFDPEQSRSYFQRLLDKLGTEGIVLAGLELENEINMAGFNPDFRLPGEGRVLGLNDLYHDPEGQQVAKGYLQYLKVLAALKGVRDHSKLNQRSPLLPSRNHSGRAVAHAEEIRRCQRGRDNGFLSRQRSRHARRRLQSAHLSMGRRPWRESFRNSSPAPPEGVCRSHLRARELPWR